MFGLNFGSSKSKSQSTQNSQASSFQTGENFSNSGSQQGSAASSYGVDQSQSAQNIYSGQEPYLQSLYSGAADLYNNYGMPDKQVAGIDPMARQGVNQQYAFSQGGGNDIYNAQLATGARNLGGYDTAGYAADRMAGGNAYGAPMDRGLDMQTAAQASYNPYLNGQIDAASRDVVRNLGENQLTGNAAMAAGTGNSGSSRRAVMDAIAMRGAGDRVADISSTMRGQAYNTGIGIAAQQGANNQQARLSTNALNGNLMGQGAQMGYNLGQAGSQNIQSAYNTAVNNGQIAQGAGDYNRQYQQQVLDTQYQNQMNPYTSLQMYQSAIGAPTVLSSANSMGVQGSNSNSFGNSSANSYGYDNSGSQSTSTGQSTSTAKSFNAGFGFGGGG